MSSLLPEHWPGDWQARPAWDVLASRDEFGGQGPQLSLSVARGVRPREVGEGRAASENTEHYRVVRSGDLVINRLVARDGAISISKLDGLISPAYWVLRPRWSHNDARFIAYQLRSSPYLAEIGRISKDMPPAQFDLPWDQFRRLPIALPREDQQRAIADYLDIETARIDALIEKKQRLSASLDERWRLHAQEVVTGGHRLRDPLRVRADELSGSWRATKLAWVFRFGSGTTPPSGENRYYDGDIPWVVTGDLKDEEILASSRTVTREAIAELGALRVHSPGGLVVAMYGATIGRLGLLRIPAAVNQACAVLTSHGRVMAEFVFYVLLAHRAELVSRGYGSGQANISQIILRELRIALPSLPEQKEVVVRLRRSRARTTEARARLGRQISLLEEHRQALITAAVTGELEVPGVAA